MSSLKVGIIGAGKAGVNKHLPVYADNDDTQVVAICDPARDHVRSVARDHHIPEVFHSAEELFESLNVDLVSICSPPQFHLEQARLAMEHGTDVLVEKPLVTAIGEADTLRDIQCETGQKLSVVHNKKFVPSYRRLIELVKGGKIGDLVDLTIKWYRNTSTDRMFADPDHWSHDLPGGRWAETLAHEIYLPYQFTDEMTLHSVTARKTCDNKPWIAADEVSVLLKLDRGLFTVRYSANVSEDFQQYELQGTDGRLYADSGSVRDAHPSPMRDYLDANRRLFESGRGKVEYAIELGEAGLNKVTDEEIDLVTHSTSSHSHFIERFIEYIQDCGTNPVEWTEAYRVMELVNRIGHGIEDSVGEESERQ